MGKAGRMKLRRNSAPTRADWASRRRRVARKRASATRPRYAEPVTHEVDRSDAQKRPATAALALITNFFFPGAGLIIYGQRKWGLTFIAVTALTLYIFWPVTMVFTTGMTANYAFRKED